MKIRHPQPDPEPALKAMPMFSTDEVPIRLNSILYRIDWETGYKFDKTAKGEIEALRVFHVNNQARIFRVRCPRGCEQIFKVADGCSTPMLYAQLESAKKALLKKAYDDIAKCTEKMSKVAATSTKIVAEVNKIKKLKPHHIQTPKAFK